MAPTERQEAILEYLERQGACDYRELAELLKVSDITIRRDIDKLASRAAVIKVLGGVQSAKAHPSLYEPELALRMSMRNPEKRAIAAKALQLVGPGQTIFLDGGTTSLELAKLLARDRKQLTIITNSFLICQELSRNKDNSTLILGGLYEPTTHCCVGTTAEEQAKSFFVDKAFVSTKGFVPREGTYESAVGLFRIKQIVTKQSGEVILLVDHSKFGQRSLCRVLDTSQINTVITDDGVSEAELTLLERRGLAVLIASPERKVLKQGS